MPAAKSRNRLPSMSSTVSPSPRTGTMGYARGRLGDVHFSSNTMWALALGPGISVTMWGTGREPASRDGDSGKDSPRSVRNAGWLDSRRVYRRAPGPHGGVPAARFARADHVGPS